MEDEKASLSKRRLARRDFLKAGGAAFLVTASVAGCDFLSTDPASKGSQNQGAAGAAKKGKEAPALAELVKQGKLPPVEERLPESPMVVEPVERIGVYGGDWTTAITGVADSAWMWRTVGYEHLVRLNYKENKPAPNIAKSFEMNDEGTEFVFKLRKGVKWSDGEPFTVDDIVFWWEDFSLNETLSPEGPPSWMITNEEPGVVEKVGDHTVRFTFPGGPNGYLPFNLAQVAGLPVTSMPRHYLEKFHQKHNPDVKELAEKEEYSDWAELFTFKAGLLHSSMQAGLPTVKPWIMTNELGDSGRLIYERNPYYWKTDPEESQLPYLDRVVFEIITDTEVMVVKAINGEFNHHARHFNDQPTKPVLAENRKKGGYDFYDLSPGSMNVGIVALNLNHKDPIKRKIFQNRDFRIGLSHAMNRQEIIDVVYQSQGEPWQAAPRPECRFHDEEMAKQYTAHDVDKANEYLDRAGYTGRDGEDFRLGPDGNPITVNFLAASGGGALEAQLIDALGVIKDHWREVGVDLTIKTLDRSLYQVRTSENEQDALTWTGWGGDDLSAIVDPRWYFPTGTEQHNFAGLWALWFLSNGEDGERPPEPVRRQIELYRQTLATPDPEERDRLFKEVLRIAKEQFYVFGISLAPEGYGIVANNYHNVPDRQPDSWPFPDPAQSYPEQYFVEQRA